jgi:hypothetical protein
LTKSKNVSSSSRARGNAKRDRAAIENDDTVLATDRLAVGLEHMRYRHAAWMAFGIVLGALMVWKLGDVGKAIGVVLIGVGGFAAYSFVRTLLFPAGTIVISDSGAELPRGLCKGEPEKMAIEDVKHVYLLRRSVPWTRAAPVLVIEAKGKAFTYPRDWFITEADQRRVVRELQSRGVGGAADQGDEDEDEDEEAAASEA